MTEQSHPHQPDDAWSHRPLAELLLLALPTVAQMASYTVMQFIDVWILSRLGGIAPMSVANSGMMAISVLSFGMGVSFLVNALVSQSFGGGQWPNCGRYLWQGIWFGLVYALAMLPTLGIALPMFRAFGHSNGQAILEASYYRIVLLSAAVKMISLALGQFMLGINRPNAVLASAMFGVSINAVAAWAFVLGHYGFHQMGVAGAAWAQNIGVTCEMLMLAALALRPSIRLPFGVLDFRIRAAMMKTLIKVGAPSGVQWLGDILAWSIFSNVVLGVLGAVAMEANAFMFRYMVVSFMPAFGISAAATALVGRYIGRGRPDLAARRAHLAFAVAIVYMFACGIAFYLFRTVLIRVFTHDPQVLRVGAIYLTYAAIYQAFDAMYIIYSGALRGAGDTFVPAFVTAILCWTLTVGGGYIAARHLPQLGWGGPWIMATIYGIIVGIFMLVRFTRGKWKLIHLIQSTPSNVANASATLAHA